MPKVRAIKIKSLNIHSTKTQLRFAAPLPTLSNYNPMKKHGPRADTGCRKVAIVAATTSGLNFKIRATFSNVTIAQQDIMTCRNSKHALDPIRTGAVIFHLYVLYYYK